MNASEIRTAPKKTNIFIVALLIVIAMLLAAITLYLHQERMEDRERVAFMARNLDLCPTEACRSALAEYAGDRLQRGVGDLRDVAIMERRIKEIDQKLGDDTAGR